MKAGQLAQAALGVALALLAGAAGWWLTLPAQPLGNGKPRAVPPLPAIAPADNAALALQQAAALLPAFADEAARQRFDQALAAPGGLAELRSRAERGKPALAALQQAAESSGFQSVPPGRDFTLPLPPVRDRVDLAAVAAAAIRLKLAAGDMTGALALARAALKLARRASYEVGAPIVFPLAGTVMANRLLVALELEWPRWAGQRQAFQGALGALDGLERPLPEVALLGEREDNARRVEAQLGRGVADQIRCYYDLRMARLEGGSSELPEAPALLASRERLLLRLGLAGRFDALGPIFHGDRFTAARVLEVIPQYTGFEKPFRAEEARFDALRTRK